MLWLNKKKYENPDERRVKGIGWGQREGWGIYSDFKKKTTEVRDTSQSLEEERLPSTED